MGNRNNLIKSGKLARLGLLDEAAVDAATDLVEQIGASALDTVRVLFADQHGILRGKTIVASAVESAFTNGITVPSTLLLKDTSNKTVFPIWSKDAGIADSMRGAGDIVLVPDPSTYRPLPWSPNSAWLLCDARMPDGSTIPFAPREVLKSALSALDALDRRMLVGLEVEFHVFKLVDPVAGGPGVSSNPAVRHMSPGYQLLAETHYSLLEQVMEPLRVNCQKLGLPVRSMEIEMGPSQLEFTFDPASPLEHADNMTIFRTMVKETCAHQGLHATFMCRPAIDNAAASGWHLHQSIIDSKTGKNLMVPDDENTLTDTASSWIAGLLEHARSSCILTTPTVTGYKRYRPHQLAPDRVQWGRDNRGAMIRALMSPGDNASRIENRVAETAANPYYFFASQILSGIDGLKRGLKAPPPVETPYDSSAETLPESLLTAIQLFEISSFYREALGDIFVDYLATIRRAEWNRYHLTVSDWEQSEYFGLY